MSLPDNIIPFKSSTIDDYGRLWIGRGYSGHQIVVRFVDDPGLHCVEVLESGRANVGRAFKGRECEIFVLKKE
jgi:hypothetical protein